MLYGEQATNLDRYSWQTPAALLAAIACVAGCHATREVCHEGWLCQPERLQAAALLSAAAIQTRPPAARLLLARPSFPLIAIYTEVSRMVRMQCILCILKVTS